MIRPSSMPVSTRPVSTRDSRYFLSWAQLMPERSMMKNRVAPLALIISSIRAVISKWLLYFFPSAMLDRLFLLYVGKAPSPSAVSATSLTVTYLLGI